MAKEWFQERGDRVMLVRYDDGAYRWRVWGAPGGEGPVSGLLPTLEEAKAKAEEVAGFGLKPADPAWMAEVAREACAMRAEANGEVYTARRYRDGAYDSGDNQGDIAAIIAALRLALERGHVVETGSAPASPSIDLEAALKRAWEAAAWHFMNNGLNLPQIKDDAARDEDVSSILSTLPAKE